MEIFNFNFQLLRLHPPECMFGRLINDASADHPGEYCDETNWSNATSSRAISIFRE